MEFDWARSWFWGLALIGLTTAIHAFGVVLIYRVLRSSAQYAQTHERQIRHPLAFAVAIIAMVGLLLVVLHGIEAFVWAAAYLWIGAIGSERDAILYSLDSLTTRGAAGLALATEWRLMGALESADGMLLFGISTAFVFTVIQRMICIIDKFSAPRR